MNDRARTFCASLHGQKASLGKYKSVCVCVRARLCVGHTEGKKKKRKTPHLIPYDHNPMQQVWCFSSCLHSCLKKTKQKKKPTHKQKTNKPCFSFATTDTTPRRPL